LSQLILEFASLDMGHPENSDNHDFNEVFNKLIN